jgi:Polysaccharide deacetylase
MPHVALKGSAQCVTRRSADDARFTSRRSWLRAAVIALPVSALVAASPSVRASSDLLPSFDHAATNQKIVALTFDADMTPGMLRELKNGKVASWYNEKVIAALRQQQAPATLFLTGLWIETYPDATKQLAADPLFELGNHSYSHGAFHPPATVFFRYRRQNKPARWRRPTICSSITRCLTRNISASPDYAPMRRP